MTRKLKAVVFITVLLLSVMAGFPVKADPLQDMLKEQQTLTQQINDSRSKVDNLTAETANLKQQIAESKNSLAVWARSIQTNSPSDNLIIRVLTSTSLTEAIQNVINVTVMTNAMNQQMKKMQADEKTKTTALAQLSAAQKQLNQKNSTLTESIKNYQISEEINLTTAPPVNGTGTPSLAWSPVTDIPLSPEDTLARYYIVFYESSANANSYTAHSPGSNYYGAYQLDYSYLGGNLSPANQDAVAQAYVTNRYGSWSNAWAFWQAHHWY